MTPAVPGLPPRFEAADVEQRWQAFWAERGLFLAPEISTGTPYTIVLPPPNVTGILTLGHMLGGTVQDLLVRYHRMRGESVLWVPGLDHAGLATQVEVRKRLAQQGVALEALSRDEILARVEEWKREHETRIRAQLRAPGYSLDWTKFRYTMDPGSVRATREAFVRLFRAGLVYRGERIVNWDPKLRTAVSDLEVVHREESGELLFVRYPWADGSDGGLLVATVRPETIFGDIAVAVHPDDERHRGQVGRLVRVPLTERTVPIITDPLVDPTFGNGALKVTPRHDPVDFEIFRHHPELSLPPTILDLDAHLTGPWVPEEFRGMDRDPARVAVTRALDAKGFLERSQSLVHSVGRSERSNAVIEPLLSKQWFVRMRDLATPVVDAVRSGEVRLHPDRWSLTFFRWMEGIEDWCISRQVVWGHPIPVYTCEACSEVIAAVEAPTKCPTCHSVRLAGDPDVLDTWFTSWLWPFLSLGWPEESALRTRYYPNSVLVTGRDIMFFWVARMLMAGLHFTGRVPFADVYFTGMLRDEEGRRMSKHLGNSPDPLEVVGEWGADTLRFAVLYPNPVDQDGPFGVATLEGARNFLTKVWNVARFTLSSLPPDTPAPHSAPSLASAGRLEDRWILSRWSHVQEQVEDAIASFEFTRTAGLLHNFLWHDVADRYLEVAKESLQGRNGPTAQRLSREVLVFVLERSLRALHPMVPHVTEELWHALPHEGESLVTARWPRPDEAPTDPEAEVAMEVVLDGIRVFRNLRSENKVPVAHLPEGFVRPTGAEAERLLEAERPTIVRLARLKGLTLLAAGTPVPDGCATSVTLNGEYFLPLPNEARAAESEALRREREKLTKLLEKTRARLADTGFIARAPPSVVAEAEAKVRELAERIERIDTHLGRSTPPAGVA
ncbi:MAG: valine--tRNA ligase [Thermoplasmata archaeon]